MDSKKPKPSSSSPSSVAVADSANAATLRTHIGNRASRQITLRDVFSVLILLETVAIFASLFLLDIAPWLFLWAWPIGALTLIADKVVESPHDRSPSST